MPSGRRASDLDVDELLQLDKLSRELQHDLDQTQAKRKSSASGAVVSDENYRNYLRSLNTKGQVSPRAARGDDGKG